MKSLRKRKICKALGVNYNKFFKNKKSANLYNIKYTDTTISDNYNYSDLNNEIVFLKNIINNK